MKTAGELAQQVAKNPHSTTSSISQADNERVQKVFARMAAQFGRLWLKALDDKRMAKLMMAEWADGLREYSDEQIDRGFKNLKGEYPPSLPAFKKACLTEMHWQQRSKSHQLAPKALPRPKISPSVVKANIAKLKEALK